MCVCVQVLKGKTLSSGKQCFEGRPGAELPPFPFNDEKQSLVEQHGAAIRDVDVMVRRSTDSQTVTQADLLLGGSGRHRP